MSKNVKSILTTAMLNADADTETPDNESVETKPEDRPTATNKQKLIKRALIATVAAAAVTYVVVKLTGSSDEDTTETTED